MVTAKGEECVTSFHAHERSVSFEASISITCGIEPNNRIVPSMTLRQQVASYETADERKRDGCVVARKKHVSQEIGYCMRS